jgi:Mg/Co/Ni transporter MgtE
LGYNSAISPAKRRKEIKIMQLTPTVISAQPLEKAIREYLKRHDHVGLEHFLSTQRAPDIADVVDRLQDDERAEVFSMLRTNVKATVLSEVGVETKRSLLEDVPREQRRELIGHLPMDDLMRLLTNCCRKLRRQLLNKCGDSWTSRKRALGV